MPTTRTPRHIRVNLRAKAEGKRSFPQRHRMKIEETIKDDYLAALPKLGVISHALKAAGATYRQLETWRERDAEFLVLEREARGAIADDLEKEAIRRGFKGVRKPVYQGGLLAGYVQEYSDQLLMFMLKALRPERFREKSEVSVAPIVKLVSGFEPQEVL